LFLHNRRSQMAPEQTLSVRPVVSDGRTGKARASC
jgi:hypothetical protein